jgi:hypothetical protein
MNCKLQGVLLLDKIGRTLATVGGSRRSLPIKGGQEILQKLGRTSKKVNVS